MIKTTPEGFEIVHSWRSDGRAYDPSAKVLFFKVDGELFEATNRLGPGWPMVIRTAKEDRTFWCASVLWEDWNEAVKFIKLR